MTQDIIGLIRENVIQGRVTSEDEGIQEGMVGQPGVCELVSGALESRIDVGEIIEKGLTGGMKVVGQRFEAKE